MESDKPSEGFIVLGSHDHLDLTVEVHMLPNEFAGLFTDADRQRAREHLRCMDGGKPQKAWTDSSPQALRASRKAGTLQDRESPGSSSRAKLARADAK